MYVKFSSHTFSSFDPLANYRATCKTELWKSEICSTGANFLMFLFSFHDFSVSKIDMQIKDVYMLRLVKGFSNVSSANLLMID